MLELSNLNFKDFSLNLSNFDFINDGLYDYSSVKNINIFLSPTYYNSKEFLDYCKIIFSTLTNCLYYSYSKSDMETDIKSFNNAYDLNTQSSKTTLYNTFTRLNNRIICPTIINFVDMMVQQRKDYIYSINCSEEIIENYTFNFFLIFCPFMWPLNKSPKMPDEISIHILVGKYILFALYEFTEFIKENNGFNPVDKEHVDRFCSILANLSSIFIKGVLYELIEQKKITNQIGEDSNKILEIIDSQKIFSKISIILKGSLQK